MSDEEEAQELPPRPPHQNPSTHINILVDDDTTLLWQVREDGLVMVGVGLEIVLLFPTLPAAMTFIRMCTDALDCANAALPEGHPRRFMRTRYAPYPDEVQGEGSSTEEPQMDSGITPEQREKLSSILEGVDLSGLDSGPEKGYNEKTGEGGTDASGT